MLRQQHQLFRSILVIADGAAIAGAQIAAYWLRFVYFPSLYDENPQYSSHALPLLSIPIMLGSLMWCGLYQPRRDRQFISEAMSLARAVLIGTVLIIVWRFLMMKTLYGGLDPSRLQFVIFAVLSLVMLIVWRGVFRATLWHMRRRGFNLRHVAIIGTGRLGQVTYHTLRRNLWTGVTPALFISHHPTTSRTECCGLPVHGSLHTLRETLEQHDVSGVFIAIPQRMSAELPRILHSLEQFPIDVRIVPDVNPKYAPVNMAVHELDGMPILSLRESPLNGWGRITKRMLDIAGSLTAIAVFSPVMLTLAVLVRMSGPGPIIFRQCRASLGGRQFEIFKFRTMVEASAEQQAARDVGKGTEAWTDRDDPRITRIGRIMRATSLDELPQLFNVLLGDMSLVGPRPERPELIARFREDWRGYMLRQHAKAGMTGWAQVNGLRGNTSLRKRLQYDLFYVRNWSLTFDLRILWLTIFRGFVNPNAH